MFSGLIVYDSPICLDLRGDFFKGPILNRFHVFLVVVVEKASLFDAAVAGSPDAAVRFRDFHCVNFL
jgi:hypothetical protein